MQGFGKDMSRNEFATVYFSMGKMITRLLEQDEALQVVLSNDWKTRHLIATWQDLCVGIIT